MQVQRDDVTVRGKLHRRVLSTHDDGRTSAIYYVQDARGHWRYLPKHKCRIVIGEIESAIKRQPSAA